MIEKASKLFSRRNFVKGLGMAAATPWLAHALPAGPKRNGDTHMVLTCNIRVALPRDEPKGNGWNDRKSLCVEVMKARQPDIICLQEVIRPQMADLEKSFPGFSSFGFAGPAMDAYPEGYHGIAKNPILFSKDRYKMISAGSYWLSETPLVAGSLSWGSGRPRHVNWLRLMDRGSRQEFRVLSTHLDHVSQHARKQQARMIVEESQQYPPDFPQILGGDFNQDSSDAVIDIIRDGGWIKDNGGWTDSYASVHGQEDPGYTVHGFKGRNKKTQKGQKGKVDFIFLRGKAAAVNASVITDEIDGRYPSDHYFVSAEVNF